MERKSAILCDMRPPLKNGCVSYAFYLAGIGLEIGLSV
jgi:hypothetical protein